MSAPARSEPRPAGFWIRAAALVVDVLVFAVAQFSFGLVAGRLWGATIEEAPAFQLAVVLFTLLLTALYTTVLHATTGQTVGKLLVRVRVVGVEGGPLPVGAALLRWLGYFLSLAPLTLGFLMAGLRRDKRALHDLLAGSRVEHLPAMLRPAPAADGEAPAVG